MVSDVEDGPRRTEADCFLPRSLQRRAKVFLRAQESTFVLSPGKPPGTRSVVLRGPVSHLDKDRYLKTPVRVEGPLIISHRTACTTSPPNRAWGPPTHRIEARSQSDLRPVFIGLLGRHGGLHVFPVFVFADPGIGRKESPFGKSVFFHENAES